MEEKKRIFWHISLMFPITEVIFKKSRYLIPLHHLIFLKYGFFVPPGDPLKLEGSPYSPLPPLDFE